MKSHTKFLFLIPTILILALWFNCCCPKSHIRWDGLYGLRNGAPFFQPEVQEAGINGMVYQRGGCDVMFDYKGGKGISSVKVEIVDSKGRLVKTVPLSLSGGVWKGKWNDWASSLWIQSTQIPVGEYTARFKPQQAGGGTITKEMSFYVIFDNDDVNAESCFAPEETTIGAGDIFKVETAVWFGSGYNYDKALVYILHPDDDRIFQIAIEVVKGEIDSYIAAKKLSDWVANHFAYDLSYHTNDAIDLLLNHTSAQCADEACFLVALLRAVGIPSHPVTADAGWEVGGYSWSFDTWVEARIVGTGKPENWYILHPHEYPSIQPTLRNYFGANYGVATKNADDVIIMANCNWIGHENEVTDWSSDLSFGRNTCQEPNQTFSHIAGWINHLCHEYWNKGHWECSPEETFAIHILPSRTKLAVGEELRFHTSIIGEHEIEETLVVRIILDDIRSRKRPDIVLAEFTHPVKLKKGETEKFEDSFRIPGDLMTSDELAIEARLGKEKGYYAAVPVIVTSRFSWKLEVTKPTKEVPQSALMLIVENPGREPIHAVQVQLELPVGFKIKMPVRKFDIIAPGESRKIEWMLPIEIPIGIAVASLTIESKDGGGVRIIKNLALRK